MNKTSLSLVARPVERLIENRTVFAGKDSELCIYDTYQQVERVRLRAEELMFCGMLTGKKVMHWDAGKTPFFPGESFIIAPDSEVYIDFPTATLETPTSCMTIEIARERIASLAEQLYESHGINDLDYSSSCFQHSHHTAETQLLLERLTGVYAENHPDRKLLIDLGITELTVRLLRNKSRSFLLSKSRNEPDANGVNAAVAYIESRLYKPLSIDRLCAVSCMSRSRLYSEFRNKLAASPCEYHKQRRMERALELLDRNFSVTKTCFELGFQNPSHFSRLFRQCFGYSPRQYQSQRK
ncbi:helix-turn-helix domain-containing protein [Endozoicomonas sp. OPT23]|uniref:helix-turn-helix domain-containing protein n=1 Tax=Endozoicomonas sp. OPT23 TaxID=2072845 RepID=UPI001890DD8A|nr:helix-turn-helix domain-containing protein [Endozoicomonas sp. OPT23]